LIKTNLIREKQREESNEQQIKESIYFEIEKSFILALNDCSIEFIHPDIKIIIINTIDKELCKG